MKFPKNTFKAVVALAGVCIVVPTAFGQGIGLRTFQDLTTATPQKVERGQKIWNENCQSCHGPQGVGDGPQAQYFDPPPPNLKEANYRWGGGPVEVYNVISNGQNGHPIFEHIAYQDRWAVTHFTRALGPTEELVDDPEVLARAEFEAKEGVCAPSIRATITDKMEFKGEAQIAQAKATYATNCSSCHGAEGKGDGAAAAALKPPPRDFTAPASEWNQGTSPLAIFNTLQNGVEGTAMAAFSHLGEEELWAMTHLIREEWLPADSREEVTDEQIDAVCRSLSGGQQTASFPIEAAMRFLAESVEEQRSLRMARYGVAWVADGAQAARGKVVYEQHCQDCHGPKGVGGQLGPYGASPPYLFVKVNALEPGQAGGTTDQFANRAIGGAHVAIPDMTGVSHIPESDWQALHAYVTSFEGAGTVQPASQRPEMPAEPIDDTVEDATPGIEGDTTPPTPLPAGNNPATTPQNVDTPGAPTPEVGGDEPAPESGGTKSDEAADSDESDADSPPAAPEE